MWEARIDEPSPGTTRVVVEGERGLLAFSEVLELWESDERFRAQFLALWATAPYPAYQWETPGVTRANIGRLFECVFVDSVALAGEQADPRDFQEHFDAASRDDGDSVASFENLGGDALLLAPCPIGPLDAYAHLAAFARGAPAEQGHRLLSCIARSMEARLGAEPVWLSTAGLGVPWVHVRLDSRPKYYRHGPYRVT